MSLSSRLPALLGAGALCIATGAFGAEETDTTSFDGLVKVESARVQAAFIDPEADFSVYKRVAFLEPAVAFRNNWLRDQNRGRSASNRIRQSDVDRIKADVSALFLEVFRERLEMDGGYEVVTELADDVLLLRPAIIDLDVNAPETNRTAARSNTFTTSAGAATLYLELFDASSGDILGRAADRRQARQPGNRLSWTTGVNNRAEARRMFTRWADHLRGFLDEHYQPESSRAPAADSP